MGLESFNLKILSITDNSALVVSRPQKADQSLTTIPAPITSLPLLTEPTCIAHVIPLSMIMIATCLPLVVFEEVTTARLVHEPLS